MPKVYNTCLSICLFIHHFCNTGDNAKPTYNFKRKIKWPSYLDSTSFSSSLATTGRTSLPIRWCIKSPALSTNNLRVSNAWNIYQQKLECLKKDEIAMLIWRSNSVVTECQKFIQNELFSVFIYSFIYLFFSYSALFSLFLYTKC